MSINPHVYNLVSEIFTIINTIVGNYVIYFIFVFLGKYHSRELCNFFHFCLSRKIHISSLYICIPFFVILYLSSLYRKLFPKRMS